MLSFLSRARKKRLDGEDGFTLIELLVVVVILGILIAIAIPVYLNYKKSANDKAAQSDLRNAISVLEVCNSDGAYPATMTIAGVFNSTGTVCPTSNVTGVNLSANSAIKYTLASTNASYTLWANNTGGSGKIYCYNSLNGGAVIQSTSATGATNAALTAATACP